ncbi:MAG TPA: T9SS type A sorting domain-containing protein, partial [Flavobacteriia bacterium]|nr:T9SS type A sorting domain-containing protein [Flavobacteriia bacterium]
YPNPVTNGILTINTFSNADKKIQIFDILGKQVISTNLRGKELNVSKLNSGIYILKILEEGKTATRKLVIK